jgi:hypothetical protein
MKICNGDNARCLKNGNTPIDLATLPRCQAIASSTGRTCKRAACKGQKYCGIHSGRYKPGSPQYNRPALKHGFYKSGKIQERLEAKCLISSLTGLIGIINDIHSTQITTKGLPNGF